MVESPGVAVDGSSRPVRVPAAWRWDGEDLEHIVLSVPSTRNIYLLNPTAALVFYLCNGHNTVSDIARIVADRFEADYDVVLNHVKAFVEKLAEMGVVRLSEPGAGGGPGGGGVRRLPMSK